ncbi:MAG: hypothetical protein RRB13_16450 [bacterium]|nr:hypothetical protein [bacterium]
MESSRPNKIATWLSHPLAILLIIGALPFGFLVFRILPSASASISAGSLVFVALLAWCGWKLPLKGLWVALALVLPLYYFACVGFADAEHFEKRAAVAKFESQMGASGDFLMGTDYEGRDILATLVIGGKHAYLVAIYTCLTALLLGVPMGLLLTAENLIARNLAFWVTQFFEIVPQLFFVLIVLGVYNFWAAEAAGERLQTAYALPIAGFAIGLSSLPSIARILENRLLQLKAERFVTALRSTNVSETKILFYNLLWKNCISEIVVQTTFLFGSALLLESALSFAFEIGFGDLGTGGYLSWGKLLAESRRSILFAEKVWIVIPPIVATVISILGVNYLGDQLARRIRKEAR